MTAACCSGVRLSAAITSASATAAGSALSATGAEPFVAAMRNRPSVCCPPRLLKHQGNYCCRRLVMGPSVSKIPMCGLPILRMTAQPDFASPSMALTAG